MPKKPQKLYPVAIVPKEEDIVLDPAAFKRGRIRKLSDGVCANCGVADGFDTSFRLGYESQQTVYCLKCNAPYRVDWYPLDWD
jgi:hypothetical protein